MTLMTSFAAAYPAPRHPVDEDGIREFRQAYADCISFTYAQFGEVLVALANSPDAANTIIFSLGDHGLHQSEPYRLNKVALFDRSARVPLVIVSPGPPKLGTVCRQPVELLGLSATLMDLAEQRLTRPAYSVVSRPGKTLGRSIHTDRFNYIEWDKGRAGMELYDHFLDPHEHHDRNGCPKYAAAQTDLKRQLAAAKPRPAEP